jgi:hypothetical protein
MAGSFVFGNSRACCVEDEMIWRQTWPDEYQAHWDFETVPGEVSMVDPPFDLFIGPFLSRMELKGIFGGVTPTETAPPHNTDSFISPYIYEDLNGENIEGWFPVSDQTFPPGTYRLRITWTVSKPAISDDDNIAGPAFLIVGSVGGIGIGIAEVFKFGMFQPEPFAGTGPFDSGTEITFTLPDGDFRLGIISTGGSFLIDDGTTWEIRMRIQSA